MSHISNFWSNKTQTNPDTRVNCCGCSGCVNKCPTDAIKMVCDEEGFYYPTVDHSKCVDCGACVRTCPIADKTVPNGEYLATYAGYAADKPTLLKCTSGGFATMLSLDYVKNGGTVVGVSYSDDCVKAVYSIAHTKQEIMAFAGSKYVQSEKNDIFKQTEQELKTGRQVLFVGCPCDVHALKLFLNKEYDNLCTIELVCMGVSTYKLAEDYIRYAEKKYKAKLISVNARSKKKGWFVPHLEEVYDNGKVECNTLFGNYLGYGMQVYNRPSCFKCKFRDTSGSGDIRIGDFWGIRDTDPYWNKDGVCCIFVRTKKGADAVKSLENAGYRLFETTYAAATVGNMSSLKNKSDKYWYRREKFSKVFRKKGLIAACRAVGSIHFWSKRIIPERWHASVKKIYHILLDKR